MANVEWRFARILEHWQAERRLQRPWQPLNWTWVYRRPFPRERRCLRLRSRPAEALLRATFPPLAAVTQSASPAVRILPACAAIPRECPSYNPLFATLGSPPVTVNTNWPAEDYAGNFLVAISASFSRRQRAAGE